MPEEQHPSLGSGPFHTELCDLLDIRYPIIQGGMAWASHAELAAAVSNAGGLGVLAAGRLPDAEVREEIARLRSMTDRPFALNIVPLGVPVEERVALVIGEGVEIVATGLSDPRKPVVTRLREAGVKVLAIVPNVRLARRMEDEGANVIIASGCEAGGHVGRVATLPLIPAVVSAVSLPVVAAGGIGDAGGFAAALALGGSGVQMGTRFLATKECPIHPAYKEMLLRASEEDTVVTGNISGYPMRVIRNDFANEWLHKEARGVSREELLAFGVGKIREAVMEGNVENGSAPAGQVTGIVTDIPSVQELIERIIAEAQTICRRLGGLV